MIFRFLILIVILLVGSFSVYADEVVLLSGAKIDGKIIEHTQFRVVIDVNDTPQTFYVGEIATINGKAPDFSPVKKVLKVKKPVLPAQPPHSNDEQDSLVRFMNVRNTPPSASNKNQGEASIAMSKKQDLPTVPQNTATTAQEPQRNVVPTLDGGLIVVGGSKLVKYDKNLNIIKEVNIK